jgi:translation initiation factor 2 beta subunit (eIF-2beta)/eIF-5
VGMNKCKDCIHVQSSGDFELKDPGGVTYIAKYCNKLNAYVIAPQKACDRFKRYIESCPFCGSKRREFTITSWWVKCDECGAQGPRGEIPTEAWNRRTK